MRILKLTKETQNNILENLLKRSPNSYGEFESRVNDIIQNVREKRDEAIFEYTLKFDGATIDQDNIRVTEEEIKEAYEQVDPKLLDVIRKALVNIRDYHAKQKQYSWFDSDESGIILGQKVTPLKTVGVYVPGGKAVYPSSVLMNVIPAKVAGVSNIIMTTPCGKDGKVYPSTLVAAKEAGVDAIYKVGGAQAIAALAFGTESIPKVDKIVGPGNIYVALAKKAVFGYVSIDSIAGPSEIMVLADETANPRFVAADLLSQAEHDEMASAILVTTSETLAEQVSVEVDKFVEVLSRKEIIRKSLDNYGYILVADTMQDAIDTVNEIASEHLELVTKNPFETMTKIRNAGAIFIGEYSSEPLGDYFAGPNHVLPTNGTAKFFSPLSVDDFIKKSSIISFSEDALKALGKDTLIFDIDNTLVPYWIKTPTDELRVYFNSLRESGIKIAVLSNSKEIRSKTFCEEMEIPYYYRAKKPATEGMKKLLKKIGSKAENSVIVGDQIFTDVWCGNKCGVYSVLVKQVSPKDELITAPKRPFEKIVLYFYLRRKRKEENNG